MRIVMMAVAVMIYTAVQAVPNNRNRVLIDNCRILIDLGTTPRTKEQIDRLDPKIVARGQECGAYLQGFADRMLSEEAVHKQTCLLGYSWNRLALAKVFVGWMDMKLIADPTYIEWPITHTVKHALMDAFPCR